MKTVVGTTAASALLWHLAPILHEAIELRRRPRRGSRIVLASGLGIAACAVAAWQLPRLFVRKPKHEVEMRRGRFEVRSYPSVRVAETTIDAGWNEALGQGLRRLARFVFGENSTHKSFAMTSPVLGTGDRRGFHVAFVMPEGVDASPEDSRIDVHVVPARRVAVLRFRGRHDAPSIERHKRELARALVENDLKPRGEATFAAYDPPWTLPLLRRNELWIELENENRWQDRAVSVEA